MTWTIPNMLTLLRVLLVPCFVFFVIQEGSGVRTAALVIFFVAAFTDYLDGRIARMYNQKSAFGDFADPLADKLLVAAALISFVFIPETRVPLWAVLLILAREVLITWLRVSALRRGETMATSFFGKTKTAAQMISIVLILILLIARAYVSEGQGAPAGEPNVFWERAANGAPWGGLLDVLPLALILITCFLTVGSGLLYLWANRRILFAKKDTEGGKPSC